MARRKSTIVLLMSILLSSNGCSAVLISTLGTNYDSEFERGETSREEVHRRFGQPISSQTYGSPVDSKDIGAATPCLEYWDLRKHHDPAPYEKIVGFEVFRVKGRVIVPGDHWVGYVFLDAMTLGLAEIVTTPVIILDWFVQFAIDKDLTVWYRANDSFAGGEIRYSNPNGLKHLIPLPWWSDGEGGSITYVPDCFKK